VTPFLATVEIADITFVQALRQIMEEINGSLQYRKLSIVGIIGC
jgi:hypothetical protein